jgi:hypothetical protein
MNVVIQTIVKLVLFNYWKYLNFFSNKSLDFRENLICCQFKMTQFYVGNGILYQVLLIISWFIDKKIAKIQFDFQSSERWSI